MKIVYLVIRLKNLVIRLKKKDEEFRRDDI